MTDYIAVPSTLDDAVGRTTITIEVVTVIALIVNEQAIAADLVAFSVII